VQHAADEEERQEGDENPRHVGRSLRLLFEHHPCTADERVRVMLRRRRLKSQFETHNARWIGQSVVSHCSIGFPWQPQSAEFDVAMLKSTG
jgi:hypothetical protein